MLDPWRKRKESLPSRQAFPSREEPSRFQRFFPNHETRVTALPSWFPIHDFPSFPTISQYFPLKKCAANQVPPRTAAAGVSASWMHRVASQAHLACMSSPVARRSMSGARITAFMFLRNTNHGLFSVCHRCARMAPPESAARTATPPSHCFPVRYGAAMERHERQIAPEPRCPHIFRRSRSASPRAPFATAPVALPEFFEEHAESLELWSPGYPLFPPRGS